MNHYWDKEEPRLVVCEAKRVAPVPNNNNNILAGVFNRQTSYGSTNQQPITVCICLNSFSLLFSFLYYFVGNNSDVMSDHFSTLTDLLSMYRSSFGI